MDHVPIKVPVRKAQSQTVKTRQFMKDISGPAPGNRPKAHVVLRYYEQYHDGSTREIDAITINKPILTVFQHAGYTNVLLDFRNRMDMDLRMFWNLLSKYFDPSNSVDYLPEELESGFYTVNGKQEMVYFPMIELVLSPIGREGEYEMHGLNPAFFTLAPASPLKPEPCVLQLTFDASWFQIIDNLEPLDPALLRSEIIHEMEQEESRKG